MVGRGPGGDHGAAGLAGQGGLVLLPAFALALLLSAARATAPDGRPEPGEGEPADAEPALRADIPPRTASRRTVDDHKSAEGNRL